MMGPDVEAILSSISAVENAIENGIKSLGNDSSYRIVTINEREEPKISNGYAKDAIATMSQVDTGRMKSLKKGLYTSSDSLNNSNGSPWTELEKLEAAINACSNDTVSFMGDRVKLMGLMNIALSRAVDAKWAICIYHDYIQRGYDFKYNDKKPSIKFPGEEGKETTGNIASGYTDNVHIPETSYDPY